MLHNVRAWLANYLAIPVCLLWAIWDALTALAYIEKSPPQLQRIENILHMPIWVVWAVVAGVLLVGALIPVKRFREVAIWTRGTGMVLSVILLALCGGWSLFSVTRHVAGSAAKTISCSQTTDCFSDMW